MKPKYKNLILVLACLSLLFAGLQVKPALAAESKVYDDVLASGWENWSWATVNLANTSPVNTGSKSIAVTFGAWQGLYLHKTTVVDMTGMTTLRFWIHGGSSGGQKMNLLLNFLVNGSIQNGPAVSLPAPSANTWTQMQIPLNTLNPSNSQVVGITWQDSTDGNQPVFYIDDISFIGSGSSNPTPTPTKTPAPGPTATATKSPTPAPTSPLAPTATPGGSSATIYDDALASGWNNWSWATVNLSNTSPVHAGSKSISVTYGAWQGLYLQKSIVDTMGKNSLQFYIHGGSAGGQKINIYTDLAVGGGTQNGPLVSVPAPAANTWTLVQLPLSSLDPNNAPITAFTWQDASGGAQPAFYVDDISLAGSQDANAPSLSTGSIRPRSQQADNTTTFVVKVNANDPQGLGDIASVTLDASPIGRGTVTLYDNGNSNDGAANDGQFGTTITIPNGTSSGEKSLMIYSKDIAGHQSNMPMGTFVVLQTPGGSIPASLPQRISYGSNAWSETAGQDWQQNSGVPWDFDYQYITWNWETWGDNFTSRFVNQAWSKNYTPMVVIYLMLGLPQSCNEGGDCYYQKLQSASSVQAYLDSLKRAAQQSAGSKPVIFNFEPDFFGFMQQYSNSSSRASGVQPNDPNSIPVALNKSGYANTLAGFGKYVVDMVHSTASNILFAPMASVWATNGDPQSVSAADATSMAQSTANFIKSSGGDKADLYVVEWSDRDAGSGIRPWWDDKDMSLPRPTRALLWENVLSVTAGKRLLLWQVPVGNMSLDNTPKHYQDNRAAYIFSHPRDLFDAGIAGVLFGGGDGNSTQVDTDGGYLASQGSIAYAPPAGVTGLTAVGSDTLATLRWKENTDPDLWKYRITYKPSSGGSQQTVDIGRQNSYTLQLPSNGGYTINLMAIDAMGKAGPAATVTVNAAPNPNAKYLYIPMVNK